MALTIVTRTFREESMEFVLTHTVGVDPDAVEYGINKAGLTAADLLALEAVDTNGVGADLKEKLEVTRLTSNGALGIETYGRVIYDIDQYVENLEVSYIQHNRSKAIRAIGVAAAVNAPAKPAPATPAP